MAKVYLTDFYSLSNDKNGEWVGSPDSCYASSTANLSNLQPNQLQFTPAGVDTWNWLQPAGVFGLGLDVGVEAFRTFLVNTLQNYGMPITQCTYNANYKGELSMKIYVANESTPVSVTFGVPN